MNSCFSKSCKPFHVYPSIWLSGSLQAHIGNIIVNFESYHVLMHLGIIQNEDSRALSYSIYVMQKFS